jgi:ABC-2 type transport system permease protein
MHKILLIIKREYLTAVKSKGFVISTIIVPLIGVALVTFIGFVARHQSQQTVRLDIIDEPGGIGQAIAHNLAGVLSDGKPEFDVVDAFEQPASSAEAQDAARDKINSGSLDAYLLIPTDPNRPVELHTKNPGNFTVLQPLSAAINQALIEARLNARGIHVDDVKQLVKGANLQVIKVSKSGESVEQGQTIGVAIGLVILLYMSLLMYGILTMRSVLEEKTTRTMEVLISAVRPMELLTGKILGVAGVAFTQFGIWILSLTLLLAYGGAMAAVFSPGSSFPLLHMPPALLIFTAIYFVGGYFLYASMFAAIGAACSNEQDAGQMQWLAMGPLVFCMCVYWLVMTNPGSTPSLLLSEIPFFAPVLMPLRVSLMMPPVWQMALSLGLLFLTILAVLWGSAKVYRVGVLMYGKRPTVPEMFRWMRYS